MSVHKITPEKVTRPIQLLAAWLTGLVIVDGSFLTAASHISQPDWATGVLVIASVINVPIFLISIFLLQTKYRPEMQEDIYYSKYLERQFSGKQTSPKPIDIQSQVKAISEDIIKQIGPDMENRRAPIEKILEESQIVQIANRVGRERILSELFIRPEMWDSLVEEWGENSGFEEAVSKLIEEGLVSMKRSDYASCQLTGLGLRVAKYAKNNNMLFAQNKAFTEWWDKQGKKHLTKAST